MLTCFLYSAVVDADTLLAEDALTLDEALKSANNAILTAINAISILVSVSWPSIYCFGLRFISLMESSLLCYYQDVHIKFLDVPNGTMKELDVSELKKVSLQAILFVAKLSMFKT